MNWQALVAAVRSADASWFVAALLCNSCIVLLWSGYWRSLLPSSERRSLLQMLGAVAPSAAVFNTLPIWAVHTTAAGLLARLADLPVRTAVSLLASAELIEGAAKLIIFSSAALLAPAPAWLRTGLLVVALALPAGTLLLRQIARRPFGRDLQVVRAPAPFPRALGWLLAMKCAELAAILCVQRSLGVALPLGTLPLVLSAVMLASLIPLTPANLVVYEAAVFALYQQLGVPTDAALALAIVQHAALLLPVALGGYSVLVLRTLGVTGRLRALGFWAVYLGFAATVGLLALARRLQREVRLERSRA